MAHQTFMAAMNAARKEFGKDWKSKAKIEKVDGQWYVQILPSTENPTFDQKIQELLAEHDSELAAKKSKAAAIKKAHKIEVEAAKPIATKESAPMPSPESTPAPESSGEDEIKKAQADADKLANAQSVDVMTTQVCPACGSTELYQGRVKPMKNGSGLGVVVDEDYIIGCHHCNWEVDTRKDAKLRPRLSTTDLPTKKVWVIADSMPGAKRKDVVEECVRQGIAYGTARTQYQHWFKQQALSAAEPRAQVVGGKIVPPSR